MRYKMEMLFIFVTKEPNGWEFLQKHRECTLNVVQECEDIQAYIFEGEAYRQKKSILFNTLDRVFRTIIVLILRSFSYYYTRRAVY
jgi:hypothetical protein